MSRGPIALMQLPVSSGSPSQPLHKRDIPTVVKGLKNHSKNATVCREYVVALHARLFEDNSREARDALSKFIHNQTGGIQTLLATMELHSGDTVFSEIALVFLYNLIHVGGKRNIRIVLKIVKRGGGRICVSIINKNPTNLRVVQPSCMVLIGIGGTDSKLPTLARLTGCYVNLLGICKQHMLQPKPAIASVLCCLASLCRGDLNLLHLHKRGAVVVVLDICVKNMQKDGSAVLRWACDLLCRLCHYDENTKEVSREGGVALTLSMCFEQCSTVEVQTVCIDLLRHLISIPEGMAQFNATGGFSYLLTLIQENNATKTEAEWLLLVNQLFRMYDVTELPIPPDSELYWTPPDYIDPDDASGENGSAVAATPTTAGKDGDGPVTAENPNAYIRYDYLSPELYEGDIADETSLADASVVCHVKPFTDPRPTPSCPSSIDFVPPVEELLQQSPAQRVEVIKRQLRRLSHASLLINKVVYDDQPRDTTMPTTRVQSVPTSMWAPTPPPATASSQSGAASSSRSGAYTGAKSNSSSLANNSASSSSSSIPTLKFSSNFESGNLRRAIQIFEDEYDLILQPDVNTNTYVQWFYFSIENMRTDVTYRFNILNMEKPSSTFNEGQRPLIFSEKRFTWSNFGWLRAGHDICYFKNSLKRVNIGRKRKDGGSGYYTLSFSLRCPHDDDRVYIANCYPYSYSDLIGYLRKLGERRGTEDYLMAQSLCITQSGNLTPLLTVTSLKKDGEFCSADEISQRGVVLISARVHPGESNASYMCKGVIDYLLDPNNEQSQFLRDNFVWKIVPMLNPDGVVNGNHRCSLSGKDLNREFISPDRLLNPTIYHMKEAVRHWKMNEGRNVMLYGDFHGHSRCRNFIIFACSSRKPTCGIIPEKLFPRTLAELAPYFSYSSSTYKVQRSKRNTGRVVFYRELGIRMSFTLEGSMMGGVGCDFVPLSFGDTEEEVCRRGSLMRMTVAHFNTAHYQTLGSMFAKTLWCIAQGDLGLNPKVNYLISELLAESSVDRGGGGASGGASSKKSVKASGADTAAIAAEEAGGGTPSFGGAYATARRHSRRNKKSTIVPASPQELQEIYRVLLRGSGLNRVSLTDGEDLDGDVDVDEDAEDEDDDNDSDGGNGDEDGEDFDDDDGGDGGGDETPTDADDG